MIELSTVHFKKMSFIGKLLRCSSLIVAVLMAMFVGSICLPIQSPVLEIDEGLSTPEAQDELKLKHFTSPSIQAPEFEHIGDMTVYHPLSDDQDEARERRNAVLSPHRLWPDGIVPYEIAYSFSSQDRDVILRSMEHWENNTCIRFRPKVSSDDYSIYIAQTPGCSSFVGRVSLFFFRPQGVSLGLGCVTDRIVLHELGHVIGFYHEHNRPDRDEFIDVIYDNIRDGAESQFYKNLPGRTNTLGLGYDFQSVMHYSRNTGAKNGSDTIRAKDPSVTSFGSSQQLSPLDIAKANTLYNCPGTVQKCGANFITSSGTFQTPNWPQTYPVNTDCEWFITLPDSYASVEITCDEEPYGIAGSYPQCEEDYLKIYDGHMYTNQDRKFGPYCEFTKPGVVKTTANIAKVVFHTGPSHSPSRRGFKCSFRSIPRCGGVLNTASGSFQSPNWPETYPVNTFCEWRIELPDARKLVELKCDHQPFGIAGGLPDCNQDYLQFFTDRTLDFSYAGPFCNFTPPEVFKMSSNLVVAIFHAGSSHSPSHRGFRCTFESVEAPTTLPPTPPPTTPPRPPCGGVLNTASGSFQTPNWPATYPVNIDCEWRIELPDARKLVELKCDHQPFGIAGGLPDCSLDYLKLYDGHDSTRDTSYGPFCHFTPPEVLKMSSNLAMAVFHAGPSHSPSRRGFRCTFESVEAPTTLPPTPPPTIPPRPPCGGVLNTASGSFQTPNWPETYPNNIDCQWTIELPDASNLVELKCDYQPFGIAGGLPDCGRDYFKVYDGHSAQDTSYGPFCHFTPPDTLKMSSNKAMAVFHAGPSHSTSRKGFRCTFQSLPSSPPPPSTPQCGGVLTTPSGSFQTQNWPSTYPVDVDCQWTIRLPNTNGRVELTFENPFGIAGSLPDCEKDHLRVYDDRAGTVHGPYCYFTPPPRLTMSSNEARVMFHAGPAHSPSRVGFKANYRSV